MLIVVLACIGVCTAVAVPYKPAPFHVGDDPADSWLAYTVSFGGGELLTYVNATWTVPSFPMKWRVVTHRDGGLVLNRIRPVT